MNMPVRQLWAPVRSTVLVSVSVQFVALRVPQLPPWVFFTRNRVSIVLAPLWMLALPFIGALGASLSLRAGGNARDRLLTALGSAWLNGGILTLAVPPPGGPPIGAPEQLSWGCSPFVLPAVF